MIHLVTLGAGGGSIAKYDRLHQSVAIGPESAGSDPGPACYDRGGMRPTVTDADVLLGYLDPEQTAVATRHMYAAPNRRTTHRLVRLDVPTPFWMRAPGECPGMFALESAMDELAAACGVDPVELRIRNEPVTEPESGRPFSTRNLVACLREGAARFGWDGRDPEPARRRHGQWLVGTGVAASTYPARAMPSKATVSVDAEGRYRVDIDAVDIGTGARTALALVAAEALGVSDDVVDVRIGDTRLPDAMGAGGSMGTASWSWAVAGACRAVRADMGERGGVVPAAGLTASVDTQPEVLDLPGAGMCVPDLAFVRARDGARVSFELLGFWSREAVWKRVELVRAGLPHRILFAVSKTLRVGEAVLDDAPHAALYVFTRVIAAKQVLQRIEQLAAAPT